MQYVSVISYPPQRGFIFTVGICAELYIRCQNAFTKVMLLLDNKKKQRTLRK